MRVRFEMYENGYGTGFQAKCDLTEKKAKELFKNLKENPKCGWAELISEDDDKYMEIIDEFEQIKLAKIMSKYI